MLFVVHERIAISVDIYLGYTADQAFLKYLALRRCRRHSHTPGKCPKHSVIYVEPRDRLHRRYLPGPAINSGERPLSISCSQATDGLGFACRSAGNFGR